MTSLFELYMRHYRAQERQSAGAHVHMNFDFSTHANFDPLKETLKRFIASYYGFDIRYQTLLTENPNSITPITVGPSPINRAWLTCLDNLAKQLLKRLYCRGVPGAPFLKYYGGNSLTTTLNAVSLNMSVDATIYGKELRRDRQTIEDNKIRFNNAQFPSDVLLTSLEGVSDVDLYMPFPNKEKTEFIECLFCDNFIHGGFLFVKYNETPTENFREFINNSSGVGSILVSIKRNARRAGLSFIMSGQYLDVETYSAFWLCFTTESHRIVNLILHPVFVHHSKLGSDFAIIGNTPLKIQFIDYKEDISPVHDFDLMHTINYYDIRRGKTFIYEPALILADDKVLMFNHDEALNNMHLRRFDKYFKRGWRFIKKETNPAGYRKMDDKEMKNVRKQIAVIEANRKEQQTYG